MNNYIWNYGGAVILMAAGAVLALCFRKNHQFAGRVGCGCLLAGAVSGLLGVDWAFLQYGDFFRIPVLLLAGAGALHAPGYLKGHGEERAGVYWFFNNLTALFMLLVTLAENFIVFLLCWEMMGMMSFALVAFDWKKTPSVLAAWSYLAACHAGAAFLILFYLFGTEPTVAFVLALCGFGLKLGVLPFHVWLPDAHPAAPAPVSALMSGAMIELGFYGIFLWAVSSAKHFALYGWCFLILGILGAFLGILFALPQNNLKRLLAYSSIENIGIMSMGFGLGFLGAAHHNNIVAFCGFSGGFLHLLNHALLKGGLFLGAGNILKATHTLDLDKMGGLFKRMPVTGMLFTLNSAGICGLPPFNGFLSEFLIYFAAVSILACGNTLLFAAALAVLILLALTGGLAAAAFAKAVGGAFLGEPRSVHAAEAQEVPKMMNGAIVALFTLSVLLIGLAPQILEFVMPEVLLRFGISAAQEAHVLYAVLAKVSYFSLLFVLFTAALLWFRFRFSGKNVRTAGTWDCGFAAPTARMEYTGTAFTQPLTDLFGFLLRPLKKITFPQGLFPERASFETEVPDGGERFLWRPLFGGFAKIAEKLHFLQSGYLHFYLLVVVVTLLIMLAVGLSVSVEVVK